MIYIIIARGENVNERLDKFNIIASLRKEKGYSQNELAKRLNVSRQTLSKYENNTEGIYAELIVGLAQVFGVKYEHIIENKPITANRAEFSQPKSNTISIEEQEIRSNIAKNDLGKFKQVFLYITEQVGAKPNIGQATLFSLLYFIDFDYYEKFETQLMGLKYQKDEYAPLPVGFMNFINYMSAEHMISVVDISNYELSDTKYLPLIKPDLTLISAQEIKHIDATLERLANKNADEMLDLLNEDTPWIATRLNELIEYESVFYRNNVTTVRTYA